jgi:hypothetical protein
MHGLSLSGAALAVAILSVLPGTNAGLYTKKSPVLQLNGKDYERLIGKSNYTSVRCSSPLSSLLVITY